MLCFLLLFAQQAAYYKPPLPGTSIVEEKSIYSLLSQEEEEEMNEINEYISENPEVAGTDGSPFSVQGVSSNSNSKYPVRPATMPDPDDVNIFSYITFSFIGRILHLQGDYKRRQKMQLSDLSNVAKSDTASVLSRDFQERWHEELTKPSPKLQRVLAKMFKVPFVVSGLLRLGYDILSFVPSLCLYWMIVYSTKNDDGKYDKEQWEGFVCAGVILISCTAASILQHLYYYKTYRLGQNVRACIVTAVYRKCFQLSNGAMYQFPPGLIVNYMSVDPMALLEVVPNLHMAWSAPLEIVVALGLLIGIVGWSSLVGVTIIFTAIPINAICIKRMQNKKVQMMAHLSTRGKLLHEVLNAIKTVKLMVWEAHLHGQLNIARHNEVKALLRVIIWVYIVLMALFTFIALVDAI